MSGRFKAGILSGTESHTLFLEAKKNNFALPAINVSSFEAINALLEAAVSAHCPIIIQLSYRGACALSGKTSSGEDERAAIQGAIVAAEYIHRMAKWYGAVVIVHSDHVSEPKLGWLEGLLTHTDVSEKQLFSSHMLDFSALHLEKNLALSARYWKRLSALNLGLEVEIGQVGELSSHGAVTETSGLYATPEAVEAMYAQLIQIAPAFTLAANFGNIHGVIAAAERPPLRPAILQSAQACVRGKHALANDKPVNFVVHGGSGMDASILKEAIRYGAVKVNIDTDLQWTMWHALKDYYAMFKPYLNTQVGNPEGLHLSNKRFYNPRAWLGHVRQSLTEAVFALCLQLGCKGCL